MPPEAHFWSTIRARMGPGYVGNVVTIRGANGYTATGQVQLYTGNNYDQDSNRDQLYYQTDYSFSPHFIGLFGFRYDNERGSYNDYYTDAFDPDYDFTEHESTQRTNFEYNLQFQGEFWHRLFYSAGGAVEKNHLYGIAGTPRLGLSYVPVRPSREVVSRDAVPGQCRDGRAGAYAGDRVPEPVHAAAGRLAILRTLSISHHAAGRGALAHLRRGHGSEHPGREADAEARLLP